MVAGDNKEIKSKGRKIFRCSDNESLLSGHLVRAKNVWERVGSAQISRGFFKTTAVLCKLGIWCTFSFLSMQSSWISPLELSVSVLIKISTWISWPASCDVQGKCLPSEMHSCNAAIAEPTAVKASGCFSGFLCALSYGNWVGTHFSS